LVAAMQGIAAIIAPILSTTLYQSPMVMIAILTALLGAGMLARLRRGPAHSAIKRMEGREIRAVSEDAK